MENNPYYNPEHMGLRLLGEIEFSDGDYQFDTLIFVQDVKTGKIYSAEDSGCSCPTPFEEYTTIESLTEVHNNSRSAYLEEIRTRIKPYSGTSLLENK